MSTLNRQNAPAGPESFSGPLNGAVDLAALAQARQNQAKAEEIAKANAASESHGLAGLVVELNDKNLQENLQLSLTVPVLVLAVSAQKPETAQSAKLFGSLVRGAQGKMRLAILDVATYPQLATAFQVAQLPQLALMLGGQAMPLAAGEMSEQQASEVIKQVLQIAAQNGINGSLLAQEENAAEESAPEPEYEVAVSRALNEHQYDKALEIYEKELKNQPQNEEIQAGIARVKWQKRLHELEKSSANLGEIITKSLSDLSDHKLAMQAADCYLALGDVESALNLLLRVVADTADDQREAARLQLLSYFLILGSSKEVGAARRKLATLLY